MDSNQERNCLICQEADDADGKMVQCDGCDLWCHFSCAGVNDSIENDSRQYFCKQCIPSAPRSLKSVASTSASVREAKLQLEMKKLAEEKLLQTKLVSEKEKQEKEFHEKTLRLEQDRKDRAISDMIRVEKEFLNRKYDLLHAQLEQEDDRMSVKSRRSHNSLNKVKEWVNCQTTVTLNANTGKNASTGLTSRTISAAQQTNCITNVASSSSTLAHQSTPKSLSGTQWVEPVSGCQTVRTDGVLVHNTLQEQITRPRTSQSNTKQLELSNATLSAHRNSAVMNIKQPECIRNAFRSNANSLPNMSLPIRSSAPISGLLSNRYTEQSSTVTYNTPISQHGAPTCSEVMHDSMQYNRPSVTSSYQTPLFSINPTSEVSPQSVGPNAQQLAARHVVPKELPSFSGNPSEWPLFWSSFETTTHMCGYTEAENLIRLQRSLHGDARRAVSCFLLHPSNVAEVITTLHTLYGRPEAIINNLLNEVRSTPAPKPEKLESLIRFGLVVRNLYVHLVSTGQEMHLANPLLLQELVEKLPANIKLDWALHKQRIATVDLSTFAEYMKTIVTAASTVTNVVDVKYKHDEKRKGQAFVNSHSYEQDVGEDSNINNEASTTQTIPMSVSSVSSSQRPCIVCKNLGHKPKDCYIFKEKNLEERWKVTVDEHLCRRCLYPHGRWPCKSTGVCGVDGCRQRHHKLLHPGNPRQTRMDTQVGSVSGIVNIHNHSYKKILFRIIPVVLHANGKSVRTLAFLDSGSDSTLMETALAHQLGVEGPVHPLCMQWTNGVKRTEEESKQVQLCISGFNSNKQYTLKGVHTINSLNLPRQSIEVEELQTRFPHLRGVPINSYNYASPGILIGLDNTKLKTTLKVREGRENEPVAAKTRLGWVLYGISENVSNSAPSKVFHICARSPDQELHELVKSFFAIESAGVSAEDLLKSTDEIRALEILQNTTRRKADGKFETGLLWKYDDVSFPDSKPMAERRMKCLERRLMKSPELYANVKQQIADYQIKGYAHKATRQEIEETDPKQVWYLPLGVVVNPKKPGKIRVVWDAASTVQGVSLNSVLLKGPDLLISLPAILNRYREKQVAVCADIREMFHQVYIRPQDKQAQRFLWRDTPSQPADIFVMDVAIFGSTCSPSSTQFVKNLNAKQNYPEFPEAANAIVDSHYVDDYLRSSDTIQEAVQLAKDVRYVHAKAGFELRHWMSNSPKVLQQIGEQHVDASKIFKVDKGFHIERILGMIWLPHEDVFSFSLTFPVQLKQLFEGNMMPTKRQVLSLVMSIFDPLGLVSTFTIHGKILVQDLWRKAVDWDDQIPTDLFPQWQEWMQLLQHLDRVKIPRCYFPGYSREAYDSLELHVFVDASEKAFATVAYFRVVDRGVVRCCLVSSKTKVAPLKLLSIPRLELQAAVIGTRLMKSITANHTLPIKRKMMWSDSSTVLSWIRSDQRRYRQFVAFRITEILEETEIKDWRWLPSRLNVADEATKWGKGPQLCAGCRWYKGPEFLYSDEHEWPQQLSQEQDTTEELRSVQLHKKVSTESFIDYRRFSKWERLIRAVAFVKRFCEICRRKQLCKPINDSLFLNREELQKAEITIWKLVQVEVYTEEYLLLKRNPSNARDKERIGKGSRLFKLSPIIDHEGVIRLESRLTNAPCLPDETKFPIIVPKNHYVTDLLIEWYHRQFGHANGETVVNEIRQKYHISELRVCVRKIVKHCFWCRLYKATPQPPRMGPLPSVRLTPYVRTFTFVGLDYFGPINVQIGRSNIKRWVALFTCLTTRAVHLEVAYNLSTESCKMAIRRFIARRGAPQEIHSDQGTNFQGASRELSEEIRNINLTLAGTFTNAITQWKFNPPYAPHMGGVWERLVRSVKTALAAMVVTKNPNEETFLTVLTEAESMVNSRPLTYLALDAPEHEALTPNHFILLSSNGVNQPIAAPTDERSALRSNWKLIQIMLDRFWTRWIKEYLPVISRRTKWFEESKPIKVGDLVIIVNEQVRNSWTRGKVIRVYTGQDGRIRKADVHTSNGVFQRPATKLAVLDVADNV